MGYEVEYASKGGPAKVRIEDGQAKWTVNIGGVEHTGSVPFEQSNEITLHRAYKAIDAFVADPPQAQPSAESLAADDPVQPPTPDPVQPTE